ncbi:CfaE/CblD family pilus tip adhesin [Citrobacter freundii]|uniref:CfaE/CblD family pilus tip adhesin n=1 Tax=Citrobacter freundii TaxID=546 RepID=UPI001EF10A9A|nr:CfaE/CblD family pilus tip adhesin [Citrobacter freundii]
MFVLSVQSIEWVNKTVGSLVSDITLKVSDSSTLQVYVPHPSVALPVPRTGRSPEAVDVDTCLYDGYDNQSHRYELTLTDQTGGSGSDFVLNNDAPPLHYTVSAGTPGLGGGGNGYADARETQHLQRHGSRARAR